MIKLICKGYDKFRHKQVVHTYKLVLNNGTDLYFDTNYTDFKTLQGIKILGFYLSKGSMVTTRSAYCTDQLLFDEILSLNDLK